MIHLTIKNKFTGSTIIYTERYTCIDLNDARHVLLLRRDVLWAHHAEIVSTEAKDEKGQVVQL